MASSPLLSTVQYVLVPGEPSTFRLEVQVLGSAHAPARSQTYELECLRNGEKWVMVVIRFMAGDYWVDISAPGTAKDFTYRKYQRTDDDNIRYMERTDYLEEERHVASFYIGVEVTLSGETPMGGTLSANSESPWNFASSDEMQNWDVVLSVGDSKFYAHRQDEVISTLSKDDIRELLAADVKDHLNNVRWEKLVAQSLSI